MIHCIQCYLADKKLTTYIDDSLIRAKKAHDSESNDKNLFALVSLWDDLFNSAGRKWKANELSEQVAKYSRDTIHGKTVFAYIRNKAAAAGLNSEYEYIWEKVCTNPSTMCLTKRLKLKDLSGIFNEPKKEQSKVMYDEILKNKLGK